MHQKHTHLTRRKNEHFAPNELAFVGAKCSIIEDVVTQIANQLARYKLAYFDASHAKETPEHLLSSFVFHHAGTLKSTTSKKVNPYSQRIQFSEFDMVFINGNHFQGASQILILDAAKEASVYKRIDQLDNIQCIIKLQKDTVIFPFLEEKYPNINKVPCYTLNEITNISQLVKQLIAEKVVPVKGLVLIGGKSTRMGTNKSMLDYVGKPQKEVAKRSLEKNGLKTYFSVAETSEEEDEIHDVFLNLGAFGGICSAFQKDPNSAWLVFATDLPFMNDAHIKLLLSKRNPSKVATTFKGKNKEFPEPLITIYEPKAYPLLLNYLAQGYSCARKMLINSEVEIVEIDDVYIRNINTIKEFETAKQTLSIAVK